MNRILIVAVILTCVAVNRAYSYSHGIGANSVPTNALYNPLTGNALGSGLTGNYLIGP